MFLYLRYNIDLWKCNLNNVHNVNDTEPHGANARTTWKSVVSHQTGLIPTK